MEIPTQDVLEGIIAMMEKTVLPELPTKYTRGQAMAGVVLLKDLAARLETLEAAQAEELTSLRATFEEIARRFGEVDELEEDMALIELRGKIREALSRDDYHPHREIRALENLLEETIVILAEAEKRNSGKALDILGQNRRTVRSHLKKKFDIQKRSSGPLEIGQLSKAE